MTYYLLPTSSPLPPHFLRVDPFLRPRIDNGSAYPPFGRNPDGTEAEPAEWQKRLDKINWDGLVLDVELMKEAASKLVGDHDFRNFCKIDAPKQLSTHRRTVISATIDPVEGEGPNVFVFNLRGAQLYNQVRHIVAMLFMIGARLESPDTIGKLLWTSDRSPQTIDMHAPASDETREILDRKPGYGMADDLPLVLWQWGYNSSELAWRTDNAPREGDVAYQSATEEELALAAKQALDPVETFKREFLELNQIWTEQRLKSIIVRHHLHALATHAPAPPEPSSSPSRKKPLVYTPHGAGQYFKSSGHVPMMRRQRADLPEEINRKWAEGRGAVKMARRAANQEQADALRVINLARREEARRLAEESEEKHGFGSWGTKGVALSTPLRKLSSPNESVGA
ncbi:pseudouridylate synthase [Pseudohyphozyma bogoriensis]|nr:pseudouridylate synthase [Pseudohyphozyma bogoriensis]